MTRIVDNTSQNPSADKNISQGGELPRTSPTQTNVQTDFPRVTEERRTAIRERFHFDSPNAKLHVYRKDPGYSYRWFNDTPGRLEQALAAGYDFVSRDAVELTPGVTPRNSDLGDRVSQVVGTAQNGGELRAYLMRIPKEIHEENQAVGQRKLDETDRAIRQGRVTGKNADFYQPNDEKIKVNSVLK